MAPAQSTRTGPKRSATPPANGCAAPHSRFWLAKAKEKGYPAQDCQYCHVSKLPKKDAFTPDDLNERGKWLQTEKDKQKAKAVDVETLKTYPGGKEQK